MMVRYIDAALRRAKYEMLEDGTFEYVSGGLVTLAQVKYRDARISQTITEHL